MGSAMKLT